VTRSLDDAKSYLRERYDDNVEARFGLLASSKDRDLVDFGIPNDFQSTKRVRFGPWYGDDEDDYSGRSCRRLDTCVTGHPERSEGSLRTLLAWGTDLVFMEGRWSNAVTLSAARGAGVQKPHRRRLQADLGKRMLQAAID